MELSEKQGRLLVFAAGPAADASRRRLLPGPARDAEISFYATCLREVIAAGSGCSVTVCSPVPLPIAADCAWQPQRGGSFGQRLRSAIGDAFEKSIAPVIVLGSDTPGITAASVAAALKQLSHEDTIVLGPSPDGGVYLIGSTGPIDEILAGVRWCSRHTFSDFVRLARRAGKRVVVLETLSDVDRPADLERWLARSVDLEHWSALRRTLLQIIRVVRSCAAAPRVCILRTFAPSSAGTRPPPAFALA